MIPPRRLLMPAALLLSLGMAAAQEPADRPPQRPEPAPAVLDERPPDAPDSPAPEAAPDDAAAEAAEEAPSPAITYGPPPPPAWWRLAGSDEDHAACLAALRQAGGVFSEQPQTAAPEEPDCGIARPVSITRAAGVALPDEPLLRCEAALALTRWTRDFLKPAALARPDPAALIALRTGPGYVCRDRVGTGEADPKPSEHALGNAIDVMSFEFRDRPPLPVRPRQGDADADEAFQRAARATACLFFTTVLGPGSNAAHEDHLHLDLAQRSSGWRLCD